MKAVRSYVIIALWGIVLILPLTQHMYLMYTIVHLPVFDATSLCWTFSGFHSSPDLEIVQMTLSLPGLDAS